MKSYNEMADSAIKKIEEHEKIRNRKKKIITRTVTPMLSICLVALLGIGIWNTEGIGGKNAVSDLESAGANKQEILTDGQQDNDIAYSKGEDIPADSDGKEYVEQKETDSDYPEDSSTDVDQAYGGSYLDADGKYIVLVTNDTEDIRRAVCVKLGIQESNVTFKTAKYSLEYLEEVQKKISTAMVNKEIPYVITSALMEDSNRIKVSVTTNDETKLAELAKFDRIGGAIEIEYTSDTAAFE